MIMMGDKKAGITAVLGKGSSAVGVRNKDQDMDSDDLELEKSMVSELIDCVHAKDEEGVLSCLKALFMQFDKEPHVEGEHLGG